MEETKMKCNNIVKKYKNVYAMVDLINHGKHIYKIYLYAKDPYEPKTFTN